MTEKPLLCAYHPTTVVFIDDDIAFLDWLMEDLSEKDLPFKRFLLPDEGLMLFNHYVAHPITQLSSDMFVDSYINEESEQLDQDRLNAISRIHHVVYDSERFNEISVAVVDHEMPKINGLELCRFIRKKHPNIRLVMLTGKADQNMAIDAFNANIIDQFIIKQSPHLAEDVTCAVLTMQYQYFEHYSNEIKDKLLGKKVASCLSNDHFSEFFHTLLEKQHLVEYYLVDEYGDFLMLDKEGNSSWFMVRDDNEIDELINLFEYYESDCPNEVLDNIVADVRERKALPFLYGKESANISIEDWVHYMVPVKAITLGERNYYYALLNKPLNSSLDISKLVSMSHGLEKYRLSENSTNSGS